MSGAYLWLKALHVIAVIAWMAGLLYLPRLFVYHSRSEVGSETSEMFKVMERRLAVIIMTPAMLASWLLGLVLIWMVGRELMAGGWWLPIKLVLVTALTAVHALLAYHRRAFEEDRNVRSERYFRIVNELPTLLLIGIVVMVIVRPV